MSTKEEAMERMQSASTALKERKKRALQMMNSRDDEMATLGLYLYLTCMSQLEDFNTIRRVLDRNRDIPKEVKKEILKKAQANHLTIKIDEKCKKV